MRSLYPLLRILLAQQIEDLKRVIIFYFVCEAFSISSFPSHRTQKAYKIKDNNSCLCEAKNKSLLKYSIKGYKKHTKEKITTVFVSLVSYAFCVPYFLGTFLTSLYPIVSFIEDFNRKNKNFA